MGFRLAETLFDVEIGLRTTASTALASLRHARRSMSGVTDIFLCVVDHFEPHVGGVCQAKARDRLEHWLTVYPTMARNYRDREGRHPAHSFFYPWDEYDAWEFEHLAEMCADGWGELELHLHHRDDTEHSLRQKIRDAVQEYSRCGALARWADGRPAFGFIHGNWALDNSRHDAGGNYCGVNNELTILREEGCYADFTFPAWRYSSQPRMVNRIFYAVDDPGRAKSYEQGIEARRGRSPHTDELLLIQGPLTPFLKRSGAKVGVGMDDGDLALSRCFTPARLDRWVRQGIHVAGRPDRVFVKLHCHGATDRDRFSLLEQDLPALFADAEQRYNDGERYRLQYVTARELFNVVKATELTADTGTAQARDFVFSAPGRILPSAQREPNGQFHVRHGNSPPLSSAC